jgi:hydrogenase maturation factor HypF (carbamoyltransferase family)
VLTPWTLQDFKLTCEDCGKESEDVSNRHFAHPYPRDDEDVNLCPECFEKRQAKELEASH